MKEADIGLGPYSFNPSRIEAVDFTWPVVIENTRIIAGRGRPEVDPWGFLLPLAPLVWAAILTALLLVPAAVVLLSSCALQGYGDQRTWMKNTFHYSGNLMSLLAVRHIPQPYQSLRDVLDDPSVTMIWQSNSTNAYYFRG
ncbi:uncharacterized protein [Panulirus ornatus]|uniref:uncharacterized protein n=1 Tax=Panulirus ornatus TaxID=150431 RepID=UPI003A83B836